MHGYGLCSRMSYPNQHADVLSHSGHPIVPDPTIKVPNIDSSHPGVQTRQQTALNSMVDAAAAAVVAATSAPAPAPSQGTQSVTATWTTIP